MIACVRAICARATSRSERARSSSDAETAFESLARWVRARRDSARDSCASSAFSSASSTETSRPTRTLPASTTVPGTSATWRTVPASSLRRVIERSAMTVPIATVVGWCWIGCAVATATDSIGSGWLAKPASEASIELLFQSASPAPIPSTAASSSTDPIHRLRINLLLIR